VVPNNGVMVYLGHPMYSGISEITMRPLHQMTKYLSSKNVWITNPNEIAERWNKLLRLKVNIQENAKSTEINLCLPNEKIEGLSLRLDKIPNKIKYRGKYQLETIENNIYLIVDLNNSAKIKLIY
jgi:hypothetical protein